LNIPDFFIEDKGYDTDDLELDLFNEYDEQKKESAQEKLK